MKNYRVVIVDMWDYVQKTGYVFVDEKEALQKARELQRLSDTTVCDPTICYAVNAEDGMRQ